MKRGVVYTPDLFIDYLENSQYLPSFEDWAIFEASKKIEKLGKPISVNISANSVDQSDFFSKIASIPPEIRSKLVIETTERAFASHPLRLLFHKIKEISNPPLLSIDDFCTGYSSLHFIQDLPFDY